MSVPVLDGVVLGLRFKEALKPHRLSTTDQSKLLDVLPKHSGGDREDGRFAAPVRGKRGTGVRTGETSPAVISR